MPLRLTNGESHERAQEHAYAHWPQRLPIYQSKAATPTVIRVPAAR